MGTLALICGIGAWVCSILVGVQAIKRQQIAVGVIAIICTLFGLIFGWVKANEWGIKNLMLAFTALFVAYIVLAAMSGSFTVSAG